MGGLFPVRIVTPEGEWQETGVESVVAPGLEGSFGVLAHHAPLISALRHGVLQLRGTGGTRWYAISDGVLEVGAEGVVILAGAAVSIADKSEAKAAFQRLLSE
jgi:F-type H+-transporting ATPase subunit epsilon